MTIRRILPALAIAAAAIGGGACSPNDNAVDGRSLFRSKGCAACHGTDGGGGTGPALVDLYGSTVEVENADGETSEVVADGEYLRESIVDPSALQVVGYTQKMPVRNLSDDEITQLLVYIESLSDVPPDVTLPTSGPDTSSG